MKKNNFYKIFSSCISFIPTVKIVAVMALVAIFSPIYTYAQSFNPVSNILSGCTKSGASCGWKDLINLINAMVHYGVQLIGMLFVLVLLYTGFMYLTSGGDAGKVKKARDMINKMMWGLMYTLCAWVIVYFILQKLGVDPIFYNGII